MHRQLTNHQLRATGRFGNPVAPCNQATQAILLACNFASNRALVCLESYKPRRCVICVIHDIDAQVQLEPKYHQNPNVRQMSQLKHPEPCLGSGQVLYSQKEERLVCEGQPKSYLGLRRYGLSMHHPQLSAQNPTESV